MSPLAMPGQGLYVITDGPRPDLLDVAAKALHGGARMLQYRDKTDDHPRRLDEARALKELCTTFGVPLIINDDIALAHAAAADGVHLGKDDGSLAAARSALGTRAILGVSCYDSFPLAQHAAREGASYVAFGAFFTSPTKPLAPHAPIELLRQSAALNVHRVAIGGITPDNASSLIAAGAQFVAVISAVFGHSDVRAAAADFTRLFSPDSGT